MFINNLKIKPSLIKATFISLSFFVLGHSQISYAQKSNPLTQEEIIAMRDLSYKKCLSTLPSNEKNVTILNNILKNCMADNGFSFGEPTPQPQSTKKGSEELLDFYKKRAEVSKQCAIKFKNEADILNCVNGTP